VPEVPRRTAYRGRGRSSGDLSSAEFGFREGGLDLGIDLDEEAKADASQARFGMEDDAQRRAPEAEEDETEEDERD
jgi:hypothetical protein